MGLFILDLGIIVEMVQSRLVAKGIFFLLGQMVGRKGLIIFALAGAVLNPPFILMMDEGDVSWSPKLSLPSSSSPVPSLSSVKTADFDVFADQQGTPASAPAQEAEVLEIPSPEISQGELLGEEPGAQAGPVNAPSPQEVFGQLGYFLSRFSKIRARGDFIIATKDKLDLKHASPEKLYRIQAIMESITNQHGRPASGRKAADLLIKAVREWEENQNNR